MRVILAIMVPVMWLTTMVWAAVGHGEKIRAVMQGVDYSTDPRLTISLVITIVVTVMAIVLHKE